MKREEILSYLNHTPVTEFRYFESIGSTNDEALSWVDKDAPDFALVLAEEQTKGRGRFDRHWVTNPGSALAFSLILHPLITEKDQLPLFSPLCGLALRETLANQFGLQAEIKWPNDVLLDGHKTAGILVEAAWSGETAAGIVMGIGINIYKGSVPPANTQLFPATCISDHFHSPIDKLEFLQALLNSLAKWRKELGSAYFFQEWQNHLAFKGQIVRIEDSQKTSIIGVVKGINAAGNLVLILDDGQEKDFAAGDVHLRLLE
jgi:BirA family transcriptional regulator, biotin operon repressor / biotin---[acetyl-CoA-carboxylase] ligase